MQSLIDRGGREEQRVGGREGGEREGEEGQRNDGEGRILLLQRLPLMKSSLRRH